MAQFSYAQLEGLWIRAGGPKTLAPLMAAIAEAESSGNSDAHNPSGATGLWQILGNPFPGNAYDPATNARMAVAKYRSQGLGAWVTYTSGAYRQFLHGNVPANLAGAGKGTGGTGGAGGGAAAAAASPGGITGALSSLASLPMTIEHLAVIFPVVILGAGLIVIGAMKATGTGRKVEQITATAAGTAAKGAMVA